jgi:hypothetical protein
MASSLMPRSNCGKILSKIVWCFTIHGRSFVPCRNLTSSTCYWRVQSLAGLILTNAVNTCTKWMCIKTSQSLDGTSYYRQLRHQSILVEQPLIFYWCSTLEPWYDCLLRKKMLSHTRQVVPRSIISQNQAKSKEKTWCVRESEISIDKLVWWNWWDVIFLVQMCGFSVHK